ncbi:galactose-1-phosphate uridylyltransferase [Myxococcota bacterium]|nr:galactose-1-phosphate uridylyltransferase [Myxococcota bacterium]MBU1429118.1 galactose-1-phosphate uridylyltransferase [Myxococcota bacterium]MBU1900533.1 galactose-1-phosphate uridylyltransferase [Myxococcota bacterium]
MSELRRDPITHRWVIIAPERALRPLKPAPTPPAPLDPLSGGNEHLTPHEIRARREGAGPNQQGWRVRVIPHRSPALRVEGDLSPREHGPYAMMRGVGAHEIILDTPEAHSRLSGLGVPQLTEALEVYQERMLDLSRDHRLKVCQLSRIEGSGWGVTARHAHAQLIALPFVPEEVKGLIEGARRYHREVGRDVFEDILKATLADGQRVIREASYVTFAPYASRAPFEVWIVPTRNVDRFARLDRGDLEGLAEALIDAARRLEAVLGDVGYQVVLRDLPCAHAPAAYFRFFIQITPHLQRAHPLAEVGVPINPIAPEEAAGLLRAAAGLERPREKMETR